jgi:hypothetical protein
MQTIYYAAGIIASLGTLAAAFIALSVYRRNSRLERARWAADLYKTFYQEEKLKAVRDKLDCATGSDDVNQLVTREDAEFTDYLNFFEYIAFLKKSKQLHDSEVHDLFGYYLNCLKRHDNVRAYILKAENGYEGLAQLMDNAGLEKTVGGK